MKALKVILVALLGFVMAYSCQHEPFPAPPPGTNDSIVIIDPNDTTTDPGDTTNIKPCDPDTVYFNRDILPILSGSCAIPQCHDAQSAQDGVVLDSYENTMRTGDVTPFNPNEGDLYELIAYLDYDPGDPNSVMPPLPYTKLTDAEIALIRKWILQGAQNLTCDECDTTAISFNDDILPIFNTSCVKSCHNPTDLQGGISLTSYDEISQETKFGQVIPRINHDPGYSVMPPGGVKLSQCSLDKITAWVNAGYPDN